MSAAPLRVSHRAESDLEDISKKPLFPIYDMMESWAAFAFSTPDAKPHHHALYHALIYQCKVRRGMKRFPLAYQHGMQLCGIGSKATYLNALRDLQTWGFITYEPGANAYKTPIVEVHFRESTGNLLDLYRYSFKESTDTSTGRNKEDISKEVEGLRKELLESKREAFAANAVIDNLKDSVLSLKEEIRKLKAEKKVKKEDPFEGKGTLITKAYHDWYEARNQIAPPEGDASDRTAAKQIYQYLHGQSKDKSDQAVVDNFTFILQGWDRYTAFVQEGIRLRQIKANLATIISQIRHGKSKPTNTRPGLVSNDAVGQNLRDLEAMGLI